MYTVGWVGVSGARGRRRGGNGGGGFVRMDLMGRGGVCGDRCGCLIDKGTCPWRSSASSRSFWSFWLCHFLNLVGRSKRTCLFAGLLELWYSFSMMIASRFTFSLLAGMATRSGSRIFDRADRGGGGKSI